MSEKRIAELEIMIMQHEDMIESLSSTLHRQQLHIETLENTIEVLATRLKSINTTVVKPEEQEVPPPHY